MPKELQTLAYIRISRHAGSHSQFLPPKVSAGGPSSGRPITFPGDAQTASLGTTFRELGQTGRISLLEQKQTV